MKNKVKLIMIAIMVAAFALPAMAQWNTRDEQTVGTGAPSVAFQSTSTMQSSGSAYSTTPILNADGTAAYNDGSEPSSSSGHPGKPKTVAPPTPEGDPTPIGDGVWVLMLLAAGYGAWMMRRIRARRSRGESRTCTM